MGSLTQRTAGGRLAALSLVLQAAATSTTRGVPARSLRVAESVAQSAASRAGDVFLDGEGDAHQRDPDFGGWIG